MGNTLKIKREPYVFTQILIFFSKYSPNATNFLIILSYLESKIKQKNTIHFTYILF